MMIVGGVLHAIVAQALLDKRRLAGRVTVNSVGASKRVVVQKRNTLEYVASTHSTADGTWEIRGMPVMPERSLVAIAFDDTGQHNAEVLDFLSQVE